GRRQHAASTKKKNSSAFAPWHNRGAGPPTPPPPPWKKKGGGGHATTADAAKKVISGSGHWRTLEGLLMRGNAGWAPRAQRRHVQPLAIACQSSRRRYRAVGPHHCVRPARRCQTRQDARRRG